MKLIVGLGNPGSEYRGTRHNVGAAIIDLLASRVGVSLKRKWRLHAWVAGARVGGTPVTLAKPRTFMNLSGNAVAALSHWFRCNPEELLVVSDDVNLELGRLRIRAGGSAGGHRGLESIIAALGTEDFPRIRVGVGRADENLVDHVLSTFSRSEIPLVEEGMERAVGAIEEIIARGLQEAMNHYNAPV